MEKLDLVFGIPEHGWMKIDFLSKSKIVSSLEVSDVPCDSLYNLVKALVHLTEGSNEEVVEWSLEPEYAEWTFKRKGDQLMGKAFTEEEVEQDPQGIGDVDRPVVVEDPQLDAGDRGRNLHGEDLAEIDAPAAVQHVRDPKRDASKITGDLALIVYRQDFPFENWGKKLGDFEVNGTRMTVVQKAPTIGQSTYIIMIPQSESVERMRAVYDKRRKLMIELMRKVGFNIPVMPQATFFVFADASPRAGKPPAVLPSGTGFRRQLTRIFMPSFVPDARQLAGTAPPRFGGKGAVCPDAG